MPTEEMMMVMMKIRSRYGTTTDHSSINIPSTTTTTFPTWKLYENPFYTNYISLDNNNNSNQNQQQESADHHLHHQNQIHSLHLPISARKIAASFWDLTFLKPLMESHEPETARMSEISELKAELESERKARKKMESLNKRLARELSEERKGREALERLCQELAKENSSDNAEINRMKREIVEERKMLRVAEVIREERVQMKLAEARLLMEEKLSQLQTAKERATNQLSPNLQKKEWKIIDREEDNNIASCKRTFSFGERIRFVLGEKTPVAADHRNNVGISSMAVVQRKTTSPEAENPHIKRGIKGFVEFPKVVRAIGCRSKHLCSKLECQKAQLKILLKQKGPVRFNGLIAS